MPLYEFVCRDCATTFDDLVRADEVDAVVCQECGSGDVVKMFSAFAVHPSSSSAAKAGASAPGRALPGGSGCCGGGCGGCG